MMSQGTGSLIFEDFGQGKSAMSSSSILKINSVSMSHRQWRCRKTGLDHRSGLADFSETL